MIFLIDVDAQASAEAAAAFAPEEVVTSPDWTGLASRLALADPEADVLIFGDCGPGAPPEQIWRLLGHHASGVPTLFWMRGPSEVPAARVGKVVLKSAGIAALWAAVGAERFPACAARRGRPGPLSRSTPTAAGKIALP